MVTEGNACGAIPWILLGLSMVDTARFQGLHYNHGPTGRAFGSFAAIMRRTVTVVTGTPLRVLGDHPVGNAVPGVPSAKFDLDGQILPQSHRIAAFGGTWMDDK